MSEEDRQKMKEEIKREIEEKMQEKHGKRGQHG